MRRRSVIYIKKIKIVVPIIVLSILLVVALSVGIAIRIDNQRRTELIAAAKGSDYTLDDSVNISKLEPRNLIINGQKANGSCYLYEKDCVYISAENLFNDIGVKYRIFNSDGILEADLPQGILKINLGKFSITIGNEPFYLAYPVIAKDGMILIPQDLFGFITGIDYQYETDDNNVRLNYLNDSRKSILDKVRSITAGKDDQSILVSHDMTQLMIKDNSGVYYSQTGDISNKIKIDVSPDAKWSLDGKTIYWYDGTNDVMHIFIPPTNSTIKFQDPYGSLKTGVTGTQNLQDYQLYEFSSDKTYKRVVLRNITEGREFIEIDRGGKRVLDSSGAFSPDRSKILYDIENKGYYAIKADGSSNSYIGMGSSAKWINNDKITFKNNTGADYLFSFLLRSKSPVNKAYGYISVTADGRCLFYAGSDLYIQNGNKEQKLFKLPENTGYVYSANINGPFISVTSGDDNVIYMTSGGNTEYIASGRYLIKGADQQNIYGNSFTSSPNSARTVMIGRDGQNLLLWLFDDKSGSHSDMFSFKLFSDGETGDINTKWIDNDILVIYTAHQAVYIDFKSSVHAYKVKTEDGMLLKGIIGE